MSSQFYQRYLPPPVPRPEVTGEDTEKQPPSKKRKKSKPTSSTSGKLPQSRQERREDTLPQTAEGDGDQNGEALTVRSKHSAVYARYESAARHPDGASSPQDEAMEGEESEQDFEIHGLEPLPQPNQAPRDPQHSAFSALPDWMQSPIMVSSTDTVPLKTLKINEKLCSHLQQQGFTSALAIQAKLLSMLPPSLSAHYNGDICIKAATGSGKTLAYVLPIIERIRQYYQSVIKMLRAIIVVPTRELVKQVRATLKMCTKGTKIRVGKCDASKPFKEEQAKLVKKGQRYDPKGYKAEQEKVIDEDEELMDWDLDKRFGPKDDFEIYYNNVVHYTSKVDILVCTPGRLVQHIEETTGFSLEHVKWFVMDEADRLLDESFQEWIDVVSPGLEYLRPLDDIQKIFASSYRQRELQKIILSATMTFDVSKLALAKLRRPMLVVLDRQENQEKPELTGERIELPSTLQESGAKVPDPNTKPLHLIKIIESEESNVAEGTLNRSTDAQKISSRNREPPIDINRQRLRDEYATLVPVHKSKTSSTKTFDKSDIDDSVSNDSENSSDSGQYSPAATRPDHKNAAPESPDTKASVYGTLIFTKTNENATRLARLLSLLRPAWTSQIGALTKFSAGLSGEKTLRLFKKRKISILIASDRASRGLDIPDLARVVNYDMPSSVENYVHRVGRTARAGKPGKAITLIAENEARWFWNEIARGAKLGRGERKVKRDNTKFEFGEDELARYQEALETLGKEAQGGRKSKEKTSKQGA